MAIGTGLVEVHMTDEVDEVVVAVNIDLNYDNR